MRSFVVSAPIALVVTATSLAVSPEPVYRHAAVAADHPVASRAGLEMIRRGGNAVDAAVAASFCLSVVRPYSCGIGGGGFMVISTPGDGESPGGAVAIDFRETAPAAVTREYYGTLDDDLASRTGVHAVAVPGTVAGLLHALDNFGTLDRATVLEPAVRAAEQGFAADRSWISALSELDRRLEGHPELREGAGALWRELNGHDGDGRIAVGHVVRNTQQARALRLIAAEGRDGFYAGPIANAIVSVMQARHGPLSMEDLTAYRVRVSEPLRGSFRGMDVLTMPPPSSGGVAMLQILGILERRLSDLGEPVHNSPAYVHLVTEAMKHAFADRASWLADSAFVDVPTDRLLDASYLDERAAAISMQRTQTTRHYGSEAPPAEDGGTSHLSVIDADGMAVACTQTINLTYGSLVAVPGFGFMLNDEMDDFTTIPGRANAFGLQQSERNLPQPGKRPLSSMSPTIVLRDGRVVIVAGASGGPRIISGTLQCVLDCLLFEMTPRQAVASSRFHHQWLPDVLFFEESWRDLRTIETLEALGHRSGRRDEIGVVQIISVGVDGIRAASDPRKGGAAAGW